MTSSTGFPSQIKKGCENYHIRWGNSGGKLFFKINDRRFAIITTAAKIGDKRFTVRS